MRVLRCDPRRVVHIGVCGQMHGVMLWRSGEAWSRNARDQLVVGTNISSLYTWQDGRCSPDFLRTLPFPRSHLGWADQQQQQQPTHFFFSQAQHWLRLSDNLLAVEK